MAGYGSYWGKALPEVQLGPLYHPFSYHSLDVVAVGLRWWEDSPSLRRAVLGSGGEDQTRAWVSFFLALHDLGKLDQRFQKKAPHVVESVAPERLELIAKIPASHSRYDHGPEGFCWALAELPSYLDVPEDDEETLDRYFTVWRGWLAAVTGHHGVLPRRADPPNAVVIPPSLRRIDRDARREWVRTLEAMFLAPVGLSLRDVPPLMPDLLAGFCSVADWLGSNTDYFPYVGDADLELGAYLASRADPARAILRDSGLVTRALPIGGMQAVFPERQPRQVQTLVDALPRGQGLTLIEAPTGSGKTEAALAYAAHLLAEGLADSIVFALPTQATANAMLSRLEAVAARLFPGAGANIVLAHGKARYNPDFISLKEAARPGTVQSAGEALVQCARWLSQSRKRAFLGQIGVCTIDQVLLGVLPVRHNFVRRFGVGRSVLIVDEVHAYDSYMYGLLEDVLRRQRLAGGSAVLLSATLPYPQRRQLCQAWEPSVNLERDAVYPLVTHVSVCGDISRFQLEPQSYPPSRTVAVDLVRSPAARPDESLCAQILEAAKAGARVAVICNLVDHAQGLARRLRTQSPDVPVDLFHARFRFCDRQQREMDVLSEYGPSRPNGPGGRVLVATQVVEQSLDLDFDWMVTQLCPADLLFQRLGRLHRHGRNRPEGFADPRVTVLVPEEGDFGTHALIYGNVPVLWRTMVLLEGVDQIEFPAAYRDWIEKVYDEGGWEFEPDEIVEAGRVWYGTQMSARHDAMQLVLVNEDIGTFSDEESRIQFLTRDGEMSLTVLPIEESGALLGGAHLNDLGEWEQQEAINQCSVSVPNSWRRYLPAAEDGLIRLQMRNHNGVWMADAGGVRVMYTKEYGLERQER